LDNPAPRVVNGLTPALAFLALALLWSQVGYLLPSVSRPLGGLVWLIALSLFPGKYRLLWLGFSALLLFGPWGAVHRGEGLWLLALLPWAAGSWGRRWSVAALLVAACGLIWSYFPTLWIPLDDTVSALAKGLCSADLSAASSGLPLVLLAMSFPLAALLIERRTFAPLMAIGGLFISLPVYWALYRSLESLLHKWGVHGIHDAFSLQWALLILLGMVLAVWGMLDPPHTPLISGVPERRKGRLVSQKRLKGAALIFILLGVVWGGPTPHIGVPALNKNIFILNKGYLNWNTPRYGDYGQHAAGMFGLLPDYLRGRGFQVALKDSLIPSSLDSAGVVVIINLMDPLDPSEEEALHRFVNEGGSLLLLGDHTGLADIRDPSNHLLAPYGLELNFDSAKPLRTGWVGSLVTTLHPLTSGWNLGRLDHTGSEALAQIWVGASLKVSPPGYPLIVGREGFSDAGNPKNTRDGYLGDFRYTDNERLGDLILVAEAHSGRGKVLVFGDTSSLQNGALVRDGDWVASLFSYLLSPVSSPLLWLRIIGALLLILGVALGIFSSFSATILAFCSLVLFTTGWFNQWRITTSMDHRPPVWTAQAPPRALLDHSHAPRAPLNQVSESSHWGLQNTLMRSGFLPRTLERWQPQELDQAKILVEIAPSKPFSRIELQAVTRFMQHGGLVIVSCGMEEFDGSRDLLDLVALHPVYVPLGPAEIDTAFVLPIIGDSLDSEARQPVKVVFHEAWEVKLSNPEAPPLKRGDEGDQKFRSLLDGYGKPLVVFAPVGNGGLLYIPDSDFLANRNLESTMGKYTEGNILFMRHCLKELAGGQ
jgi:hypothetical protein